MQTSRTCSNCHGTGKVIKEPCTECKGKGQVRKNIKISVNIPEGVMDGQTIPIREQGEPGVNGGPKGDLYIVIRVKRHSIYTRKGDHVLCEIPITFTRCNFGSRNRDTNGRWK